MMQTKLLVFLFLTILVSSSVVASVLQAAYALTPRTDFSNRHSTASLGNSKVCGDHLCGHGGKSPGKGGGVNSGVIWFRICGGVRC